MNTQRSIIRIIAFGAMLFTYDLIAQPITVQTVNIFPPPITYAGLQDALANAQVTLSSSSPNDLDVRVSATLTCLDCQEAITIRTKDDVPLTAGTIVAPGTHVYALEELGQQFLSSGTFDETQFEISGGGISFSSIQADQMLPGGTWRFCIQLLDFTTGDPLSPPIPNDDGACTTFITPSVQPPVISPFFCGSTITHPNEQVLINWSFPIPPQFTGTVEYAVDIAQFDSTATNANDAMQSNGPPWLISSVTEGLQLGLQPEEFALVAGGTYAVRVQARSTDDGNPLPVENNGYSVVCQFTYAPEEDHPTGVLQAAYPRNGDAIPFTFFPIIAKFEPYENYTRFDFHTWVSGVGVPDMPERDDHDSWPHGPIEGQGLIDLPEEVAEHRAQHLPIYFAKANMPGGVSFQRGGNYRWRTDGTFTHASGPVHGDTGEEPFQVGMGPSKPQDPPDGAIKDRGAVPLTWFAADIPDPLTPPFDIVQLDGTHGPTSMHAFDGWVDEHWKLEVSRSPDFSTIFYQTDGAIGSPTLDIINAIEDPGGFASAVYPTLHATVTATEDGTYYWRLKWQKDPNNEAAGFYNPSEVFRFIIGSGSGTTPVPVTPPPVDGEASCIAECNAVLPTNTTPIAQLAPEEIVRVGKFDMKIEEAHSTGTAFAGTGTIKIRFLNSVNMKVEFTDLKVNTDHEAYGGTVNARKDWNGVIVNMITAGTAHIPGVTAEQADAMNGFIEAGGRFVSLLSEASTIGLPLGIDRDIAGRRVTVGLINMVFEPERAHMDVIAGIAVPEIDNTLAFGVGDICFSQDGPNGEVRAYLAADISVHMGPKTVRLIGGASTDVEHMTYMDWDCHGFKCLQLAGAIDFPTTSIIPAPGATSDHVSAYFSVKICRGWDFIAHITMDPFQSAAAHDWVFTLDDGWWDFSNAENPTGMVFPEGYDHPALHEGSPGPNLWKGFYLHQVHLRPLAALNQGGSLAWSVNNVLIDETGITANASIEHLLDLSTGNVRGWAFAIDSIYLDVQQDVFRKAGLNGRIGLPVFRGEDALKYSAVVGYVPEPEGSTPPTEPVDHGDGSEQSGLTFNLKVEVDHAFTIPMWVAQAHLKPDSKVEMVIAHDTYLRAVLNGDLSINTDNPEIPVPSGIPAMSFDLMNFEDLVLDSDRGFSCGTCNVFGLASPQHGVAGFPVTIEHLALVTDDPLHPTLEIEPKLTIGSGESLFSASVGLSFIGELETSTSTGIKRFHALDPVITSVVLDTTRIAGITLAGTLNFIHTSVEQGMNGSLYAAFPMGISGKLEAAFGNRHQDPLAAYNTAGNFNYWRVDGTVYFGDAGIPLFAGVGLYGFGGGAYYHMQRSGSPQSIIALPPQPQAKDAPAADPPTVASGYTYSSNYLTPLGIRLGLVLGTYPKPDALNMDVSFEATTSSAGGLGMFNVHGNLYGFAGIANRSDAKVTGIVDVTYSKSGEGAAVVFGAFDVFLNMGVIKGGGEPDHLLVHASFYTGPDGWFFKMGEPKMNANSAVDGRGNIVLDQPIFQLGAKAYIMAGSKEIPTSLPPLPQLITDILNRASTEGEHGRVENTANASSLEQGGRQGLDSLATGAGFAFGAEIPAKMDLDLVILYAKLAATIGFDMNLTKQTMLCAGLDGGPNYTPGSNGWYAQGQLYAGLEGEVGIQLPLIFTTIRVPIVQLGAAMVLQGNLPNPFGFRGEAGLYFNVLGAEGQARLRVEAGDRCVLVNNDPLAGMRFIREVKPSGPGSTGYDLPTATFSKSMGLSKGMGQVFEVPRSNDGDGNITVYRFRPYVKAFEVKENVGWVSFSEVTGCTRTYTDDTHASIYLNRVDPFKPNRMHRIHIRVQVEEQVNGVFQDYVKDGQVWHEDTTVTFTTGNAPDVILESNVDYTYPVTKQRFFLPGESNHKGAIKVGMTVASAFPASVQNGAGTAAYTYRARFVPVSGGASLEAPVSYTGGTTVALDLPVLLPEQVYTCQIIRRRELTGAEVTNANGQFNNPGGAATANVNAAASNSLPLTTYLSTTDQSHMTITSASGQLQQARIMAANEHLVYQFGFRTSKYATLHDKLASVQLKGTVPSSIGWGVAEATGHAEEDFDVFDMNGVWKGSQRKLAPLLGTLGRPHYGEPGGYDDYYRYLDERMYALTLRCGYDSDLSFPNGETVSIPNTDPAVRWPSYWSTNYPSLPLVSYTGTIAQPIADQDLEAPPAPGATSGSAAPAGDPYSWNLSGISSPSGGWLGNTNGMGGTTTTSQVSGSLVQNLRLGYRAKTLAEADRWALINRALIEGSRSSVPSHRNLMSLLAQYDQLKRNCLVGLQTLRVQDVDYITYNQPKPSEEFAHAESADYHVKFGYRVPTVLTTQTNTSVTLPFTLHNTTLPDVYQGTVLDTMY